MVGAARIRIDRVSKAYGLHHVLDEVSLTLEPGGTHCLMGPSGAGKTSLLRIVIGLEHANRGRVVGLRPGQASVVFQEERLRERLTPVENAALLHPDRRVSRSGIRRNLAEILPEHALDRPVGELSGGMRRRVSLGCAVGVPSRALVLDEPFTGLDRTTKRGVIDYLLRHRAGRTLLVTTHQDDDVALLGAERIELQRSGRR